MPRCATAPRTSPTWWQFRECPPSPESASAGVSAEALALLEQYRWPGNVRQLENAVFRAVVLAEADTVGVEEFPQVVAQLTKTPAPLRVEPAVTPAMIDVPQLIGVAPFDAVTNAANSSAGPGTLTLFDRAGEVRPLEEIEAEVIRFAISHYGGQMSEVARRLRIGRSTLYRKLEHLGLDDERKTTARRSGKLSHLP